MDKRVLVCAVISALLGAQQQKKKFSSEKIKEKKKKQILWSCSCWIAGQEDNAACLEKKNLDKGGERQKSCSDKWLIISDPKGKEHVRESKNLNKLEILVAESLQRILLANEFPLFSSGKLSDDSWLQTEMGTQCRSATEALPYDLLPAHI